MAAKGLGPRLDPAGSSRGRSTRRTPEDGAPFVGDEDNRALDDEDDEDDGEGSAPTRVEALTRNVDKQLSITKIEQQLQETEARGEEERRQQAEQGCAGRGMTKDMSISSLFEEAVELEQQREERPEALFPLVAYPAQPFSFANSGISGPAIPGMLVHHHYQDPAYFEMLQQQAEQNQQVGEVDVDPLPFEVPSSDMSYPVLTGDDLVILSTQLGITATSFPAELPPPGTAWREESIIKEEAAAAPVQGPLQGHGENFSDMAVSQGNDGTSAGVEGAAASREYESAAGFNSAMRNIKRGLSRLKSGGNAADLSIDGNPSIKEKDGDLIGSIKRGLSRLRSAGSTQSLYSDGGASASSPVQRPPLRKKWASLHSMIPKVPALIATRRSNSFSVGQQVSPPPAADVDSSTRARRFTLPSSFQFGNRRSKRDSQGRAEVKESSNSTSPSLTAAGSIDTAIAKQGSTDDEDESSAHANVGGESLYPRFGRRTRKEVASQRPRRKGRFVKNEINWVSVTEVNRCSLKQDDAAKKVGKEKERESVSERQEEAGPEGTSQDLQESSSCFSGAVATV